MVDWLKNIIYYKQVKINIKTLRLTKDVLYDNILSRSLGLHCNQ